MHSFPGPSACSSQYIYTLYTNVRFTKVALYTTSDFRILACGVVLGAILWGNRKMQVLLMWKRPLHQVRIYECNDGGKRRGQLPAGSVVRNPAELGIPGVYDDSHHLNQLRLIPYR